MSDENKRGRFQSHKKIIQEQAEKRAQYQGPMVEQNNKVSLVMLSCRRLHLLQKTCEALFAHIDKHEQNIDFEYIIVDNGSDKELTDYVDSLNRFNKKIYNSKNLGIGRGLNQGFMAATGEFIFQLEDDWLCNMNEPFIGTSLEVLKEFDDIGIVRLKAKETRKTSRNVGETRFTSSGAKVYPWFPTKMPCGVYCFGCGVFKRQAFYYTGQIPTKGIAPRKIEHEYARMFEKYYNGSRVEGLLEAFEHIGGRDKSPGWKEKRDQWREKYDK